MIHLQENFLSRDECREIVEYAKQHEFVSGTIGRGAVNPYIRKVAVTGVGERNDDLNMRIKAAVEAQYGVEVKDRPTMIQLLKYEPGGHYSAHNDGHNVVFQDEKWIAKRYFDRDLSVVLYLNEDFEGGDFVFNHLERRIKPKTGMLLAFPSDWRHEHHVEPTALGTRYAMVNWYPTTVPIVCEEELDPAYISYYQMTSVHYLQQTQKAAQDREDAENRDRLSAFLKRKKVNK